MGLSWQWGSWRWKLKVMERRRPGGTEAGTRLENQENQENQPLLWILLQFTAQPHIGHLNLSGLNKSQHCIPLLH